MAHFDCEKKAQAAHSRCILLYSFSEALQELFLIKLRPEHADADAFSLLSRTAKPIQNVFNYVSATFLAVG
jgi:hypothetical protein